MNLTNSQLNTILYIKFCDVNYINDNDGYLCIEWPMHNYVLIHESNLTIIYEKQYKISSSAF